MHLLEKLLCLWTCYVTPCWCSRDIIHFAKAVSLRSASSSITKKQSLSPEEIRKQIEREIQKRVHLHANQNISKGESSNGSVVSSWTTTTTLTTAMAEAPIEASSSMVAAESASSTEKTTESAEGTEPEETPFQRSSAAPESSTPAREETFSFWKQRRKNAETKKEESQHVGKRHGKKTFSTTLPASPVPNGTDRVLFFWAVGAEDRVIRLVMANIAHAREQLTQMDVYLAHYDSRQDLWKKRDPEWYRKNIDFASDSSGYKFQMMRRILSGGDPFAPDLKKYAWVWALDEDVDFTTTNLPRLFEIATESGALLGLPTFTELDGNGKNKNLNYPMQMPQDGCSFRYSPVVEVIFPFVRPAVLSALFHDCHNCIHEKSVWGLDRIWCTWSARLFHRNPSHACVLIDETPVIHKNFKTLRGKYIVSGAREMQSGFMDQAMTDFHDVQKHHHDDFVEGAASEMQSSTCVVQQFQRARGSHGRFRRLHEQLRSSDGS